MTHSENAFGLLPPP